MVHDLGLTKDVCFLGKLTEFVKVLQNSDIFLMPSETESFGLAALEALSCGVPVIGSNIGGIPELVRQGETGFLSAVGNVEEMAKNAVALLKNQDLYGHMSAAARQSALVNWKQSALVDRYEEYYRSILDGINSR